MWGAKCITASAAMSSVHTNPCVSTCLSKCRHAVNSVQSRIHNPAMTCLCSSLQSLPQPPNPQPTNTQAQSQHRDTQHTTPTTSLHPSSPMAALRWCYSCSPTKHCLACRSRSAPPTVSHNVQGQQYHTRRSGWAFQQQGLPHARPWPQAGPRLNCSTTHTRES